MMKLMMIRSGYVPLFQFVGMFLCLAFSFSTAYSEQNKGEDSLHEPWDELTKEFVHQGLVDYQGFENKKSVLQDYLSSLATIQSEDLSHKGKLAFYINGYNACTVSLILNNRDKKGYVSSIKDIGGFFANPWKISFCNLGGKTYTLDEVEHDIIRPTYQDPRIHFAVNCASKSCPPLLSGAYLASSIDKQLDMVTRAFINSPKQTQFEGDALYLSKIFKWYEEDFVGGVVSFILHYAGPEFKTQLENKKDNIRVKFMKYDWTLNSRI